MTTLSVFGNVPIDLTALFLWMAEVSGTIATVWVQAGVLLFLSLLLRRLIRQPALRVSLAWVTLLGLTALPLFVLVPGWRQFSWARLTVPTLAQAENTRRTEPENPTPPAVAQPGPSSVLEQVPAMEPEIAPRPDVETTATANIVAAANATTEPATTELATTLPAVIDFPDERPVSGQDSAGATAGLSSSALDRPNERSRGEASLPAEHRSAVSTPLPPKPSPDSVSETALSSVASSRWWQTAASLGGVLVVLAGMATTLWILLGQILLGRLLWRTRLATDEPLAELRRLCDERSLRCPRLLLSADVATPSAVGTLRPAILLPEPATHSMPTELLRHALRHELAHIERGDLWLLAWSRWLAPLYVTQPLWWLFRRGLRIDQELTADLFAAGDDPVGYAGALVEWAKVIHKDVEDHTWLGRSWLGRTGLSRSRLFRAWGRMGRPEFQLADSPSSLTRRVTMLLDPRRMFSGRVSRWAKAALALLLVAVTVVASLFAVSEADPMDRWFQAQWGALPKDHIGHEVALADGSYHRVEFTGEAAARIVEAPAEEPVVLPATNAVAQINPPRSLSDEFPAKAAETPIRRQATETQPTVQLDCIVGWIDDERLAAATGAYKLVLPTGTPLALSALPGDVAEVAPLAIWLKTSDMKFRFELAREQGLVKILGEPSLVTRYNIPAEFFSGEELPQLTIVERRNGVAPPQPPQSKVVPLGMHVSVTVHDRVPRSPSPFDVPALGSIKFQTSWTTRRDETTIDRQVLEGTVDWADRETSLLLMEPLPTDSGAQPPATRGKRLFTVVTPRLDLGLGKSPLLPPQATPDVEIVPKGPLMPDPLGRPVAPKPANASVTLPPDDLNPAYPVATVPMPSVPTPPRPVATVPMPAQPTGKAPYPQELPGDVQFLDELSTPAVMVEFQSQFFQADPAWTVNKGQPKEVTYPLDPALTWSFLPVTSGDSAIPFANLFLVPLSRDLIQLRFDLVNRTHTASVNGQEAVVNGVAHIGHHDPLFRGVVVSSPSDGKIAMGRGTLAIDAIVRPDYGVLSDGSPGLQGFSGVLRIGGLPDTVIGERHGDLTPSRLAKALLSRELPSLCPFQVPRDGGLMLVFPESGAFNTGDQTLDDGPQQALFITFRTGLSEKQEILTAERALAARQATANAVRPPAVSTADATTPVVKEATSQDATSVDAARARVLQLLSTYPHSQTPIAEVRREIANYDLLRLRREIARFREALAKTPDAPENEARMGAILRR